MASEQERPWHVNSAGLVYWWRIPNDKPSFSLVSADKLADYLNALEADVVQLREQLGLAHTDWLIEMEGHGTYKALAQELAKAIKSSLAGADYQAGIILQAALAHYEEAIKALEEVRE